MTPCRRCHGSTTTTLVRADGLRLVRCQRCRTVQLDPESTSLDPGFYEYYAEREDLPVEVLHLPLTTDRLRAVARDLSRRVGGRRLLDVGCGEGQLVASALMEGWQASGIDLSAAAIRICRRIGLDCSETDLFSDRLILGSFDAITMIELVEHVEDPRRVLARVEELLAPGGLAYLTTPNYHSLGRRVLGEDWGPVSPAHLWYFSPRSLRSLVRAATDLEVVALRTKNLSAAALRRIARRRPPVDMGLGGHVGEGFAAEQELRHRVESSALLRAAKAAANGVFSFSGTGETIALLLRKGAIEDRR
jgi:2-polyprenyl-3-methyl-5-hydroxy-6-metoxy-1,4-benzoquinol methylase